LIRGSKHESFNVDGVVPGRRGLAALMRSKTDVRVKSILGIAEAGEN
jgi:hypothetical protein